MNTKNLFRRTLLFFIFNSFCYIINLIKRKLLKYGLSFFFFGLLCYSLLQVYFYKKKKQAMQDLLPHQIVNYTNFCYDDPAVDGFYSSANYLFRFQMDSLQYLDFVNKNKLACLKDTTSSIYKSALKLNIFHGKSIYWNIFSQYTPDYEWWQPNIDENSNFMAFYNFHYPTEKGWLVHNLDSVYNIKGRGETNILGNMIVQYHLGYMYILIKMGLNNYY